MPRRVKDALDDSDTAVRYLEVLPPIDLRPWVEALAIVRTPSSSPIRSWRLVPDARTRLRLPLTQATTPTIWPGRAGPTDLLGMPGGAAVVARLLPWAMHPCGASEGQKRLKAALGRWRPPQTVPLDVLDTFAIVSDWLRLAVPRDPPDLRVVTVWSAIASARHYGHLPRISRALGVSGRTVGRLLHRSSGWSFRTVFNLERFRRALQLLRTDLSLSWARAAIEAGYYDQAHLVRVFQRLVGMPPGRFFGEAHHHANDIFARPANEPIGKWQAVAVGCPALRPVFPPRLPERHGRR
jgi:AraC-like DNA-binding protein